MSSTEVQKIVEQFKERIKGTFWEYLGGEIVDANEEQVTVAINVQKHHTNSFGIVHGGVISTMLDNVMGVMAKVRDPEHHHATTNLNIHFLTAIKEGRVEAKGWVLHESRSTLTLQSEIRNSEGVLCAMATASFRKVK